MRTTAPWQRQMSGCHNTFPPSSHYPNFSQAATAFCSSSGMKPIFRATATPKTTAALRTSPQVAGRLATLVIGPQVKPHYRSTTRYDHANLLTTICAAMGLSTCPGAGSVENPMSDFFNTVNISTPFANAAVASPVRIQATTSNNSPVHTMQLYVDNVLKYQVADNSIDTSLPIPAGKHFVVAQSWDSAGGIHKRGIYVNVQSQAVVVTNPAPRQVVGSEVQVGAIAGGQSKVSKMQLYVDGNSQFQSSGNTLNTSISLSAGNHTLNVEAADSAGNLASNKFSVTSARPSIHILSPASPT